MPVNMAAKPHKVFITSPLELEYYYSATVLLERMYSRMIV